MAGKIFKTNNVLRGDGSPGGSTKHVQFNDNDSFGGATQLFWDKVNNRLGVGALPTTSFYVKSAGSSSSYAVPAVNVHYIVGFSAATTSALWFDFEDSGAGIWLRAGQATTGFLGFATRRSGANYERMRITNLGKVGIGKTGPLEKLDIDGAVRLGTTSGTNNGTIRWNGTNFQGYKDAAWVNLDGGGNPGGADTQIQFNNSGAFGGHAAFTWTSATNTLNLANSEISSKDSVVGDFTLDSTPLVHAWTWDYRAANLIQNRQAQVLATDGTSHSFSAGLALHHVDSDGTNYKTSGTIHQMYGLECQLAGTTTSASYKDMVGVFSRVMNRTEWSSSAGDCGRGCGGFQTEVHQYGAGIADNEFHIFDPGAGAEGGHAQSKSIAGLQIVLHHHFANEDATHISRGLMIDTFGKRITSGITMSSNVNGFGNGYAKHAIDMSALKTSDAAIKMPGSVSGSTGTYIEYDPNDYTYYSRSTNSYAWIIGGSQRLATSATATDVAGTLNAAGATNLYGKLSIGPGVNTEYDSNDYSWYDRTSNVFNWIVGGVTGLLVGGGANAVAIRVNSTLLYISRSADVDGTGKHYLVVS